MKMIKDKILRPRRPANVPNLWFMFIFIVFAGILIILIYNLLIYSNLWRIDARLVDKPLLSRTMIEKKYNKHLWFMKNGSVYPTPTDKAAKLLPEQAPGDRIIDQLMYVPSSVNSQTPLKTICPHYLEHFYVAGGTTIFEKCPVNRCTIGCGESYITTADVVLFKQLMPSKGQKLKGQLWVGVNEESPRYSHFLSYSDPLNWTANVRTDSDIVYPYEKWIYYNSKIRQIPQKKNYALKKTKLVAWIVSRCDANNSRLEYAKELSNYIPVDIYGECGTLKCPRNEDKACTKMIGRNYKFYLAFENSNCRDYITEKFFTRGLQSGIIPVAMGAFPEDYKKVAPENSYILVNDFAGPKQLAQYLWKVAADDTLYNSYFLWKGTGEFIDINLWCRLCTMLHSNLPPKYYEDYDGWFSPDTCV